MDGCVNQLHSFKILNSNTITILHEENGFLFARLEFILETV